MVVAGIAPVNIVLQDLERQLEDVTQQMQNSTESVRIRELESERRLAEERIAELEGQLAGDTAPTQPVGSGRLLLVIVEGRRGCRSRHL